MTKIVQLKDGDGYKYLKTHVDAIDGIDGKLVKATGDENISGKKNFLDSLSINSKRVLTVDDLPSDNTSLSVVNGNDGTVRLYRQGKVVTIFFAGLNGKSGGGNDSTILTIPAGYRPPISFEELVGSTDRSALNSAAIGVGTDGTVKWRRNSSYGSDYTFVINYTIG